MIRMFAMALVIVALASAGPASSSGQEQGSYFKQKEVVARSGIVAAADYRASEAGLEVLKRGGNAVDAAVTTAFLMAVYKPGSNGIGGHGGQMGLYWARTGEYLAIDSSARAPARATPNMFEVIGQPPGHPADVWRVRVKDDANAIGFRAMFPPSTVAGYWHLIQNHGTLAWSEILAPAIKVADEGFVADPEYVRSVESSADELARFPGSAAMYLPGGKPPKVGDRIVFPELASTLKKIAAGGRDVYYKGEIADRIVDYIQKNGGILTKEDFTRYEVDVFPLTASQYRGYTILTYPQGSNGAAVAEVLNILSQFDLKAMGYNSVAATHTFIEALKLAFIDRYEYVGDRDFEPIPYDGLMSWTYGRERAKLIRPDKARIFAPGDPWKYEASGHRIFDRLRGGKPSSLPSPFRGHGEEDTTFLTAADKQGNLVLLTSSLLGGFGSKVTVPGLGITLNNSMYSTNPVPGHPLSIGPFRRALRNSGVCIVVKGNRPYLVASAPGGRNIITAVLRTVTNVLDFGMGIQAAIDAPRIHAEANLYEVRMEARVPAAVRTKLGQMGHKIVLSSEFSGGFAIMQGILIDPATGLLHGGSDPRTIGGARGF